MKQGQSLERQFLVKEEGESGRFEMCQKMLENSKNQYQNKQKGQPNQIEKRKKKSDRNLRLNV